MDIPAGRVATGMLVWSVVLFLPPTGVQSSCPGVFLP